MSAFANSSSSIPLFDRIAKAGRRRTPMHCARRSRAISRGF